MTQVLHLVAVVLRSLLVGVAGVLGTALVLAEYIRRPSPHTVVSRWTARPVRLLASLHREVTEETLEEFRTRLVQAFSLLLEMATFLLVVIRVRTPPWVMVSVELVPGSAQPLLLLPMVLSESRDLTVLCMAMPLAPFPHAQAVTIRLKLFLVMAAPLENDVERVSLFSMKRLRSMFMTSVIMIVVVMMGTFSRSGEDAWTFLLSRPPVT